MAQDELRPVYNLDGTPYVHVEWKREQMIRQLEFAAARYRRGEAANARLRARIDKAAQP